MSKQTEVSGGDDARPFRAQVFIPCIINQCMVPDDAGNLRRSRMQLHWARNDGTLLARPFNDGPFYRCERPGCFYRDNPRGLHEINSRWVQDECRARDTITTEDDITRKGDVLV